MQPKAIMTAENPNFPIVGIGASAGGLAAFEALGGDVVVKPLFGGEGRGITRVSDVAIARRVFTSLEQIGAVLRRYADVKRERNVVDYDDLLIGWLALLREHADVQTRLSQQFQHLLVDEYQDSLLQAFDLQHLARQVVVDAGNGSLWQLAPALLEARGQRVDERLDEAEARLLDDGADGLRAAATGSPRDLFDTGRMLTDFRHQVIPLREVVGALLRREDPAIGDPAILHFRDVYDHLLGLGEILESQRDVLAGLRDVHLTVVSNQMNRSMQQLAAWGAILIVATLGFFVFRGWVGEETWKLAGMFVGVYTGGTVNLGAIATALRTDQTLYLAAHTSDVIVSSVYLLILMTVGQRLFLRFLPAFRPAETASPEAEFEFDSYTGIFAKKTFVPLLGALGLAVLIFVAGGLSFLVFTEDVAFVTAIIMATASLIASVICPGRWSAMLTCATPTVSRVRAISAKKTRMYVRTGVT